MNREDLIDNLTGSILGYIYKSGVFPNKKISRILKPKELAERFDEFENLIDLHFILREDVVTFVSELPNHLRSIKTQTKNISKKTRGITEGNINWGKTIKRRYSENPKDNSLFVCDDRTENYDIPENLVLKKLLSIIYHTILKSEELFDENPPWLVERWEESKKNIEEMKLIFERNVHINRIKQTEAYEPTQRMLFSAKNSRNEVYREAAKLLESRNKIHNKDHSELKELLENTALIPKDDETLLEMYVLFQFMDKLFDIYQNDEVEFKEIKTGKKEVGRFLGEKEVVIYHNNSARDKNISFKPDIDERDYGDYDKLSRTEKVQKRAHEIMEDYFDSDFVNYTKRPDVIMLEIIDKEENEYEYLITEIKNSTNEDTIKSGIKETLEYLAFLRVENETEKFVYQDDDELGCFGKGCNGILVIQDLEDEETLDIENQKTIKILQASQIEDNLEDIIQGII